MLIFESEQVETWCVWGRECRVRVIADVFPGEKTTSEQQIAYESFLEQREDIFQQAYDSLKQFLKKNYPNRVKWERFNILSYIIPKSVYIPREKENKRVVYLLFDFRFNMENDLVVRVENEIVSEIGTQNSFSI